MNDIEWNRSLSEIKGRPEFNADREVRSMCSVLRNMIKAAKGCQGYKRDVDEDSAITAEKLAGEFIMEMRKLR